MGCGTGNQLVADRRYLSTGTLVGLDRFRGMLKQAQPKSTSIYWVQGDSASPPFSNDQFDLITNQYSFHHVDDKTSMIKAVFRMLRPRGRFVMTNIDPYRMMEWPLYRYFPAALAADMRDFTSPADIVALLTSCGFNDVTAHVESFEFEQSMAEFLDSVVRRDTCSQLMTISDDQYVDGIAAIRRDITKSGSGVKQANGGCLLTVRATKGGDL